MYPWRPVALKHFISTNKPLDPNSQITGVKKSWVWWNGELALRMPEALNPHQILDTEALIIALIIRCINRPFTRETARRTQEQPLHCSCVEHEGRWCQKAKKLPSREALPTYIRVLNGALWAISNGSGKWRLHQNLLDWPPLGLGGCRERAESYSLACIRKQPMSDC